MDTDREGRNMQISVTLLLPAAREQYSSAYDASITITACLYVKFELGRLFKLKPQLETYDLGTANSELANLLMMCFSFTVV